MLSKSLSTSKKYAQLYDQATQPIGLIGQALYPLLVAHADDFGRLEGDVFTVRNSVVPASNWPDDVLEAALGQLHAVHLIVWYDVEGERFLQIVDWDRHQVGLHKRTKSRFPRVPGNSRKFRGVPLQLNRTELKGTELKGTRAAAPDAPRSLPLDGQTADDNYAVIEKLAHLSIDVLGFSNRGDLEEDTKARSAEAGIAYNSAVVGRAVDSAIAQRRRRSAS